MTESVMQILSTYEVASGQKINKNKTTVFFQQICQGRGKGHDQRSFGVQEINHYEKYLGLPSLAGKGKKASFNYIKERVWQKLQGWECKLLSQAGRKVLIKAVIQAIPTYAMRCFKLLIGLCHEIEGLIRRFWWGQRGDQRKIHGVKWDELTKVKDDGGMGFCDLTMFNDSLLVKWWLLQNKTCLF